MYAGAGGAWVADTQRKSLTISGQAFVLVEAAGIEPASESPRQAVLHV